MKKKIEIEIPSRIGIEGETKSTREQAAERRLEAITWSIAKRTKIQVPGKSAFAQVDKVVEKGKISSRAVSVEIDLTQAQIDKLPVGLKKMLK